MPNKQLRQFLEQKHVQFDNIKHSATYTANETAQSAHVSGKMLAKSVIVKLDGKLAMVVLSAKDKINFDKLEQATGAKKIELATEREFQAKFPECEVGAMPPFGNLYGLDVYVDKALTENDEIVFNAGSHTELIRLAYKDFARIAKPKVLDTH